MGQPLSKQLYVDQQSVNMSATYWPCISWGSTNTWQIYWLTAGRVSVEYWLSVGWMLVGYLRRIYWYLSSEFANIYVYQSSNKLTANWLIVDWHSTSPPLTLDQLSGNILSLLQWCINWVKVDISVHSVGWHYLTVTKPSIMYSPPSKR